MNKKEFYLCEACGKVLIDPTDGVIVQGNIYVADTGSRGGLIGCNLPKEPRDHESEEYRLWVQGYIMVDDIHESVFCRDCFLKALGWEGVMAKRDWEKK